MGRRYVHANADTATTPTLLPPLHSTVDRYAWFRHDKPLAPELPQDFEKDAAVRRSEVLALGELGP
jgi:hypothetical protein